MGKPAFVVFDNKTLQAIADARPGSLASLGKVKGIGKKKLDDFGLDLLEIVRNATGATASTSAPTATSTLASAWGLETPGVSSGVPTSGSGGVGLARVTPTKMAPLFNPRGTPQGKTQGQSTPLAKTPGLKNGVSIPASVRPSVAGEVTAAEARANYDSKMNRHQKRVVDSVLKHGRNVFFHGAAGTGKSFVLHTLIALLREKHGDKHETERVAVTAPSGIAAVAVGGWYVFPNHHVPPPDCPYETDTFSVIVSVLFTNSSAPVCAPAPLEASRTRF